MPINMATWYLPTMAPMHKDGMNKPQGIFKPKVKIVATILKSRARPNCHMAA